MSCVCDDRTRNPGTVYMQLHQFRYSLHPMLNPDHRRPSRILMMQFIRECLPGGRLRRAQRQFSGMPCCIIQAEIERLWLDIDAEWGISMSSEVGTYLGAKLRTAVIAGRLSQIQNYPRSIIASFHIAFNTDPSPVIQAENQWENEDREAAPSGLTASAESSEIRTSSQVPITPDLNLPGLPTLEHLLSISSNSKDAAAPSYTVTVNTDGIEVIKID
ncbi:hypothetical protein LTR70_001829 [Exophiala xenobiotica]|uniref:Uncharacterized protein n=1 Tax=Lithohypha guttulata TaxID=1690604 RepID=A0ABR0KNW1_9EURO|nr:hypothetical protein LTR24_000977 [Lithohypha guttulata]KAK5327087.1 hypothetical protein LTR70_001829 [Exophiala xenobiotica]